METRNKSTRRRREAASIGSVLENSTLSQTGNSRLGRVDRLYRLIVGPSLAEGSAPVALYGTCVTIAVSSKALESLIQAVEGFLLKTWSERLEAPAITEVRYVVSPSMCEQQPVRVPFTRAEKAEYVTTDEMVQVASELQDEKLRKAVIGWMSVLHERMQEDV